jgi:hypothetical protein
MTLIKPAVPGVDAFPCLAAIRHWPCTGQGMFGFFSTRLGCLGSLVVSVVGSALLMLLARGCTTPSNW